MIYALSAITLSAFFGTAWGLSLHALAVNQQKMIMDPSCLSITCEKHGPLECIPPLELKQDPKTCCPICHGPSTDLERKFGLAPLLGDNIYKTDLHTFAPDNCKGAKCFKPHCFGKQKVVYRKGMCCESCSRGATLGPDEILSENGKEVAPKLLIKGHLKDVKGKVANMKAHHGLDHFHATSEAHSVEVNAEINEEKHHFDSGVHSVAEIKANAGDKYKLEKGPASGRPSKVGGKYSSKSKYSGKYSSKSKSKYSKTTSSRSSSSSKSPPPPSKSPPPPSKEE